MLPARGTFAVTTARYVSAEWVLWVGLMSTANRLEGVFVGDYPKFVTNEIPEGLSGSESVQATAEFALHSRWKRRSSGRLIRCSCHQQHVQSKVVMDSLINFNRSQPIAGTSFGTRGPGHESTRPRGTWEFRGKPNATRWSL